MSKVSGIKLRIENQIAFRRNREPHARSRSKSYWLGYLDAAREYGAIDNGEYDLLYDFLQGIVEEE